MVFYLLLMLRFIILWLLFVHGLERLISCYGSIYDSTLRTLFLEFYRILNHCLAITTHAIDIGLFTTMLWSFEEREKLINFSEVLSGTRFHAAFVLMGRLRYDIALRWIDSFVYFLIHFPNIYFCCYSLNSIGVLSGIITSISHGFSSVGLFLFSFLLILPARLFILQHNIRSFYYSWMSFFLY